MLKKEKHLYVIFTDIVLLRFNYKGTQNNPCQSPVCYKNLNLYIITNYIFVFQNFYFIHFICLEIIIISYSIIHKTSHNEDPFNHHHLSVVKLIGILVYMATVGCVDC